MFYGTTQSGGTNGAGTVFKVNKDGTDYIVLHHFTGNSGSGGYRSGAISVLVRSARRCLQAQ